MSIRRRLHRRFLRVRDYSRRGAKAGAKIVVVSGLSGAGSTAGSLLVRRIARRKGKG